MAYRKSRPDKVITPPDLSKLKVGGERPPRAQFGRSGSKWQPFFDKVLGTCPQWIHWDVSKPCKDHVRFSEACDTCKRVSVAEVEDIVRSISTAINNLYEGQIICSYRRNEIWVRALREDEIGNYVDPEA